MNRILSMRALAKGMAAVAVLSLASMSPALSLAAVDVAAMQELAASLAARGAAAEASARAAGQSSAETQVTIRYAIENAIAVSGAAPETAMAALEATLSNMQKAGTLTPAISEAIAATLAKVRLALRSQDAPGALGSSGGGALGAPPPAGSGGGSDYRPAS